MNKETRKTPMPREAFNLILTLCIHKALIALDFDLIFLMIFRLQFLKRIVGIWSIPYGFVLPFANLCVACVH